MQYISHIICAVLGFLAGVAVTITVSTRSQNFQRLIVALSKEFEVSHQIIFTTSMIDPELDKTDLCVGPAYGPDNKTLRF